MSDPAPDAFIVRILGSDGKPAGVGAMVAERKIVTCAHVVNVALGLDRHEQASPSEPVTVDFPLAGNETATRTWLASVQRWLPPSREGVAGDDIAGLTLLGDDLPPGVDAVGLAVDMPRMGRRVQVFGYPQHRPDGGWVEATIRGRVGNGRIQLDSDSALRVERGFSGSPVYDDAIGRVVGLIAAAPASAQWRDSYAIGANRLRLAWPEALAGRWQRTARAGRPGRAELTALHISDLRFGGGDGAPFERIRRDLADLSAERGLRPDLLIVTGDLTASGLPSQFNSAFEFLVGLSEAAQIPRRHVAVVPGDHDVNRMACRAYFDEQESKERVPTPPYFPKWSQFVTAFGDFYADVDDVTFTPDEPWTLFAMPDLSAVIAGLNSTMAATHRDADHYGQLGERQLHWFAERLADYRSKGWLRLAAVHHSATGAAGAGLHDVAELERLLGQTGLANLLVHGQARDAEMHRLGCGLPALSGRYQLITVRRDGFAQYARRYAAEQDRWLGDSGTGPVGSDRRDCGCELADVHEVFPRREAETGTLAEIGPDDAAGARADAGEGTGSDRIASPTAGTAAQRAGRTWRTDRAPGSPYRDFLERVAEATQVRWPRATVSEREDDGYLRVLAPIPDGGAEQFPIGVILGPATEAGLDAFIARTHAQFAAADPSVRSELVYSGPAASGQLVALALRRGVRLRSFVEYQGLLDLRPLVEAQAERLAADRVYPARLYVPQRYRMASPDDDGVRAALIEQAIAWLSADNARLIIVLGDFGRGKTSFLRQLTRTLPGELPALLPVLVELRSLEKAPTLDELLAQYLVKQGVEDISPAKLRYMVSSGRIVLLFDGFDELELRVGYDNAADYLQILLESVSGNAKVVLTSRSQHFRSTEQVRTALGERVDTLRASRVVVLEDFSEQQIIQFLSNLYGGDAARARARFDLLSGIGNLLDLAHNPRMLGFVAEMGEERLLAVRNDEERVSAAGLYREIIDVWLSAEEERQRHPRGQPSLGKDERLAACTALALRLWESKDLTIALKDLSEEIAATLTGLSERGYSDAAASHSIGSGSLLVMADDGAFAFVHQSIMEWLVASAAAGAVTERRPAQMLAGRSMPRLMVEFFTDLAGRVPAARWAETTLADPQAPQTAKQNALAVRQRIGTVGGDDAAAIPPGRQNLARVDLRGQDLTGRDLRDADLRAANLRGMRLEGTDLSGADLRAADLRGVRMVGGSLRGADLVMSRWDRAALLAVAGLDDLKTGPELYTAAVVGRDGVDFMTQPPGELTCAALSPDGSLLAVGVFCTVQLIDMADRRVIRVLRGHTAEVNDVTFSRTGTLLATASDDKTARIWDFATGSTQATLTDHIGGVYGVAFSPDGSLLATASEDKTARIWDIVTGATPKTRLLLPGHTDWVRQVAFSPNGRLLATASDDKTARIWDIATGATVATLHGHTGYVLDVAFSPDGWLLATASDDKTVRIWDIPTGREPATRTSLEGHTSEVNGVAFSPDGTLLATASHDQTARLWDIATGTVRTTMTGHADAVTGVGFSADESLLVTTSADVTVRTWDLATGAARGTLTGNTDFVTSLALSPDGTLLATAAHSGNGVLWNLSAGTAHAVIRTRTPYLNGLAFSPDGTLLATASDDKTARIWDIPAGTVRSTLKGHTGEVNCVAFSPDGTLLATASDDRTARIWDVATGSVSAVQNTYADARGLAFSPDGTLLATTGWDDATIWDLRTEVVPLRQSRFARVRHAIRSSPKTFETRTTLEGHTAEVACVVFSPDGTMIATGSEDTTARIYDLAGHTLYTLRGHCAPVFSVVFSPGGSLLATGSDVVRIWDLTTGARPTVLVTLIALAEGGYCALTPDGYKLDGDPGNDLWWAVKLCRFAPGELDPYVPGLRRLPADAPILPAGKWHGTSGPGTP